MGLQVRTLSNNIVLRPVLELSPEDLGRTESPLSRILSGDDWLACLAAAGMPVHREIVPGSWLVFADDIATPRALRTVARAHLGSPDGPGLMSALSESALQGGFVLMEGDEVVLAPGCCGHLGHVAAWRRAVQHRSAVAMRMHIGHPEVSVTYEGGLLCLHEKQDDEHQNKPKMLRVTPEALEGAVELASKRVVELMSRLRPASRSSSVATPSPGGGPGGGRSRRASSRGMPDSQRAA